MHLNSLHIVNFVGLWTDFNDKDNFGVELIDFFNRGK